MVNRSYYINSIKELLQQFPAVGLVGPRQVGKTTIARQIDPDAIYLDIESSKDRAKLSDPYLYLSQYKDRLVILDEIQFAPEIMNELRGLIDEKRNPGRFLILGSSSPDMIRQSSDSLAGRIAYIELSPFLIKETGVHKIDKLWIRGGFPNSFLASSDKNSLRWRKHFIKTYIERDLPLLGLPADPVLIEKFWIMLCAFQGNLWNAESFSRSLGVTGKTIESYMNYMESAFMVRRLYPFTFNIKKRLVKSPKVYIRDSGMLHYMLGLENKEDLYNNPIIGASWESFAIEQIINHYGDNYQYYFYRTHQGTECDLLLTKGNQVKMAIEIKFTSSPKISKGLKLSIEDLKPEKVIIVTPQGENYPLSDSVNVTTLERILV